MNQYEEFEIIIDQTKRWITNVVIACNFCPFASKVVAEKKVHYRIEDSETLSICLEAFLQECERLDSNVQIETTLIILPKAFRDFESYLDFIALAEKLLVKHNYEGVYQIASFHPDYCFGDADENDPANYTNRSPYPMLHLLRESSIERALANYKHVDQIPVRNIQFAREKGEVYMKMLRDACLS